MRVNGWGSKTEFSPFLYNVSRAFWNPNDSLTLRTTRGYQPFHRCLHFLRNTAIMNETHHYLRPTHCFQVLASGGMLPLLGVKKVSLDLLKLHTYALHVHSILCCCCPSSTSGSSLTFFALDPSLLRARIYVTFIVRILTKAFPST
jgi:hypothetical protein